MNTNTYYFAVDDNNEVVNSSTSLLSLFYNLIFETLQTPLSLFDYEPLDECLPQFFKIINGIQPPAQVAPGDNLPPVATPFQALQIATLQLNDQQLKICYLVMPDGNETTTA